MNHDVEVVGIGISLGAETLTVALLVLILNFCLILINVQCAAGHIGKGQHVGVGALPVPGRGDQEGPGILVQNHLGALAQSAGGVKRRHFLLVGLPILQLGLDVLHGTLPPLAEPRGELSRTVLAAVSVLQLAVAQQPDITAADGALLFVKQFSKQSHNDFLLANLSAGLYLTGQNKCGQLMVSKSLKRASSSASPRKYTGRAPAN